MNGGQEYYENPYGSSGAARRRGGSSSGGSNRGYPQEGDRGGYYGKQKKKRKRRKRGTEYQKMFWGIHRIMSTGKCLVRGGKGFCFRVLPPSSLD